MSLRSQLSTSPPSPRRAARALVVTAATLGATAALAGPASAHDGAPCGAQQRISWTSQPVQPCPLTSPLPPNGWVPVYAHAGGSQVGWLHGVSGQLFVCQSHASEVYHHPTTGWYNDWWAKTLSDDNHWGWVPEVFFTGGENDEADGGLRVCPQTAPAPRPAPPPPRATPAPTPAPVAPTPVAPAPAPAPTVGAAFHPVHVHVPRARHKPKRRRARLTLSGSRRRFHNGQSLTLRGRLLSRPRPKGVVVEMQALFSPRHWEAFGIAVTTTHGHFSYRYRFSRTTGRQVYRLRALVPSQRGYALRTGVSKPLRVVVRG